MATEIISNGSKWAGQAPDTLPDLLRVLREHPLDRRFLACSEGNYVFAQRDEHRPGWRRFWGNFLTVSHVFDVRISDPAVARELILAIRDNLRRHRWNDSDFAPVPGGHRAREERQQAERWERGRRKRLVESGRLVEV